VWGATVTLCTYNKYRESGQKLRKKELDRPAPIRMEKGLHSACGTAARTEDSLETHSDGECVGQALTLLTYIRKYLGSNLIIMKYLFVSPVNQYRHVTFT
jgi:hypothetical protein